MGGVNTNHSADGFAWSSTFLGAGSTTTDSQRRAGRLQPAYSGKLVRVDLSDFSASGVQVAMHTCVERWRGSGKNTRSIKHDVCTRTPFYQQFVRAARSL